MSSPPILIRTVCFALLLCASVAGAASRQPVGETGLDLGSASETIRAPRSANAKLQAELSNGNTWKRFQSRHGQWRAIWNEATHTPSYAFGPGIPLRGFANESGAVDRAAREFMAENPALFGQGRAQLELASAVQAGRLWYVRYRQMLNGVPVLYSNWQFQISTDGRVAGFGAEAYGPDASFSTRPRLIAAVAREAAKSGVAFNAATDRVSGEDLYIVPLDRTTGTDYRLAYGVRVETRKPRANWFTLVDASSGEVLWRLNQAHDAISGNVTVSTHTTLPTDPLATRPARRQYVAVGAATDTTDTTGFYTNSPSGTVTVIAEMSGPYVKVLRENGTTNARFSRNNVTNPTSVPIAWTSSNSLDSERDAYYHVNVAHDFVKSIDPNYTGNDFQIQVHVNDVTDECGSYWVFQGPDEGLWLNEAGSICPNLATLPDVLYHEYAHSRNDKLYYSLGASLGMENYALQEALADVFAAFITGDPVIGQGFLGPGTSLRTLANTRKWPQDANPDGHESGLILSGALWDLRAAVGPAVVNSIAHFALYGLPDSPNDGEAFMQYLIKLLVADDNDIDLSNGSPHMTQIVNAFNAHGIGSGYFIGVAHTALEDQPTAGPYPVTAQLTYGAPFGALQGATLYWTNNNGQVWNPIVMNPTGNPDEWGAEISAQTQSVVRYYILANDNMGGTQASPGGAPTWKTHAFIAGPASTVLLHDFETSASWTVGASGDNAVAGIWARLDPLGTPAQPDNDHTSNPGALCYVTANGSIDGFPGEADVDEGKTTLLTPIFDGTAGGYSQVVSFWRWYSNNVGDSPNIDTWRVDISNNGGSSWTPVENTAVSDLNWRRVVFRINQFITPTSNMRMRFIAEDAGEPSLIEAAVDDFELLAFPPQTAVGDGSEIGHLSLAAPARIRSATPRISPTRCR